MPDPEADLPLATPPTQQRILELGPSDKDAEYLQQNLSALAARDGLLWLGGDEGRSLYRLQRLGEHRYGDLCEVKLKDFGLAGGKDDGESDIEGLARDGDRLWLVGSHSLRRRKPDDEAEPLRLHDRQSRNAHVLGCLQLNGEGLPVAGQRLALDPTGGGDVLTRALAADTRIAPFLTIPSKENGLDIEGIAASGERVLAGLRGPVLRGIALVLDLRVDGLNGNEPTLTMTGLHVRYLQLGGLAVRDLAVVPGSEDVLVLAGPTMTMAGPCYLYRWRNALRPRDSDSPIEVLVEEPEPLLWIRDGRPGRPGEGSDKPEGLEVQRLEGSLMAWVAYDDPTVTRRQGQGARTRLDGFVLPD
ncbi:DUF3616 domain-containing protein [Synechococcus sp. J7-Johnson]|uniref:DUF3616 domain-containing protein n=1 Tax=Synechococcus sp. J7-Johnson TaxID=2823737 RepID=UPI0020CFB71A|nr:DUF3616 domain-containing protein [Synechococcus sp. J7-Johnson]MCP9842068.1 DUF3616 domain-containing protein [Synechococcus sp. J7-Johnson]